MAKQFSETAHIDSVKNGIKKCFAELDTFTNEDIDAALELITIKTLKKGEQWHGIFLCLLSNLLYF